MYFYFKINFIFLCILLNDLCYTKIYDTSSKSLKYADIKKSFTTYPEFAKKIADKSFKMCSIMGKENNKTLRTDWHSKDCISIFTNKRVVLTKHSKIKER